MDAVNPCRSMATNSPGWSIDTAVTARWWRVSMQTPPPRDFLSSRHTWYLLPSVSSASRVLGVNHVSESSTMSMLLAAQNFERASTVYSTSFGCRPGIHVQTLDTLCTFEVVSDVAGGFRRIRRRAVRSWFGMSSRFSRRIKGGATLAEGMCTVPDRAPVFHDILL